MVISYAYFNFFKTRKAGQKPCTFLLRMADFVKLFSPSRVYFGATSFPSLLSPFLSRYTIPLDLAAALVTKPVTSSSVIWGLLSLTFAKTCNAHRFSAVNGVFSLLMFHHRRALFTYLHNKTMRKTDTDIIYKLNITISGFYCFHMEQEKCKTN
jgi:hypothetical protein